MTDPTRVCGYARVSTPEQGTSGLGLDAQRHTIAAEAERRAWRVEFHADEGVSGSVRPEVRPALGGLLDSLAPGDVLVCAKLDRLGRRTSDVLDLADRAEREGWALVALDIGIDTTTPAGRLVLTMLAALAAWERDVIAARTTDAMAAAKRRGARFGQPPAYPQHVRERVAALRDAGWTYRRIAAQLTAEGVPTARGGTTWQASTVWRVCDSLRLDAEAEHARQDAA